jgi:hypothetical protein
MPRRLLTELEGWTTRWPDDVEQRPEAMAQLTEHQRWAAWSWPPLTGHLSRAAGNPGFDALLCTEMAVNHARLTGHLQSPNRHVRVEPSLTLAAAGLNPWSHVACLYTSSATNPCCDWRITLWYRGGKPCGYSGQGLVWPGCGQPDRMQTPADNSSSVVP